MTEINEEEKKKIVQIIKFALKMINDDLPFDAIRSLPKGFQSNADQLIESGVFSEKMNQFFRAETERVYEFIETTTKDSFFPFHRP